MLSIEWEREMCLVDTIDIRIADQMKIVKWVLMNNDANEWSNKL